MSYLLTTHKIPDCMTRLWHANCMTSLRGHRTPLVYSIYILVYICKCIIELFRNSGTVLDKQVRAVYLNQNTTTKRFKSLNFVLPQGSSGGALKIQQN